MTETKPSTKSVTLHLPIDVIASIARLSRELEQPQSEILVVALRRGLEFLAIEFPPADLEQLSDRVTALEALPAQVAELAAEVDRLLKFSLPPSEASPRPASIPQEQVEQCPRCQHKLSAPLKTSGRQVCVKCGWTNRPRTAAATHADLPPDQLKRLLDQAAADAIANMKPKKPAPSESKKASKKFPFGDRS